MRIIAKGAADWRRRGVSTTGAAAALAFAALIGAAPPAMAQFAQQGAKLVGSGGTGTTVQGVSAALSADGNTAIVGGNGDNSGAGAAWVYTRSGGTWSQQGSKLVGTGNIATADQGLSVALSADGNTAIVGGPRDDGFIGAAWVFTRSGDTWNQQAELVGTGNSGESFQGASVALSADGNTALVGGYGDNSDVGATWVFTRSGSTWSQQAELLGTGNSGASFQGASVALSADGNTALVGGYEDNSAVGAAWVFTRSSGTWSQQGEKLVGTGNSGASQQGQAVALSADGNTALVGGYEDNSQLGAVWVFTRSGGAWSQQGAKLVGTGNSGASLEGASVALSASGNTALVGGYQDNSSIGAAWVFTRSGGTWSQQEGKLVGTGNFGTSKQGRSVALSADGNTALVGGAGDNNFVGAAWTFVRTLPTNSADFNDDGVSDILWRNSSTGDLAAWLMSGGQLASGADFGQVATAWTVAGSGDFNADGTRDILWRDSSTGDLAIWFVSDGQLSSGDAVGFGQFTLAWSIAGIGDFNGDGTADILWRNNSTGDVAIWLMSNGGFSASLDLGTVPLAWAVVGSGDFNGDGSADILWRNTSNGELAIWFMSGGQISSSLDIGRVSTDWSVVGTGDFDGDGVSDILWRDSEGDAAIWLMNSSGQMASGTTFSGIPATWSVAATGDFDGDGRSDILWIDTAGDVGVWLLNGLTVSSQIGLGNVGTTWRVQGANAD